MIEEGRKITMRKSWERGAEDEFTWDSLMVGGHKGGGARETNRFTWEKKCAFLENRIFFFSH